MSDPHEPTDVHPGPGDAHAQQERLKDAFPGVAAEEARVYTFDDPDTSLLSTGYGDAPAFPTKVLGTFWKDWVETSARAANAPVDYTAGTLLATAGALLGNVRWPNVEGAWEHPSVLWIGLVGNPSTAKSPGMRPVRKLIQGIEQHRAQARSDAGAKHRLKAFYADWLDKAWKRNIEEALQARPLPEALQAKPPAKATPANDDPGAPAAGIVIDLPGDPLADLPAWPIDAEIPAAPVMEVLHVVDATTEGLIATAAGSHRGLLQFSDELAGWFGGFDRYRAKGVSADRPFWLKAFDGDPYSVIRKGGDLKNGVRAPVEIPHLSIGVIGSVQPDPLRDFLTKTDDGLAHRFLWMWPEPTTTFKIPRRADAPARDDTAPDPALAALLRIDALDRTTDGEVVEPTRVELTEGAVLALEEFGQRMLNTAAGKSAWYASTLNKAPGQVLRLSAVLTFLDWSAKADATLVPTCIERHVVVAAIDLMDRYFLKQAQRVRQTAAVGDGEADARAVLAILRQRNWRTSFTGRQLQRVASGRLANTTIRNDACDILVEAGLLELQPEREGPTAGRKRQEYRVNTGAIWPSVTAESVEEPGVRQTGKAA